MKGNQGKTMNAKAIIIWLIVGAIAGWLAGMVVKGGGYGLIGNIIVHCRWPDRRLAFAAYRRCNRWWRYWRDHQLLHRRGYPVGYSETDQTIRRRIAANFAKLPELLSTSSK
jgi:hypothetical protein